MKAGFNLRSQSPSCNQKCRTIRSNENQTNDVRRKCWSCLWLHCLESSEHWIVGVLLWAEDLTGRAWELGLWLVGSSASPCDTPTIIVFTYYKHRSHMQNQKKMKTFWFFQLQFCWAYDSDYNSDFQFSPGQTCSYNYEYNSNPTANKNQPSLHCNVRMREGGRGET